MMGRLVPVSLSAVILSEARIAETLRACDVNREQRKALLGALKGDRSFHDAEPSV